MINNKDKFLGKRYRLILILAAAFAVMLVVYLLISPLLKNEGSEGDKTSKREMMFERISSDDVYSIEVHNNRGSYTFVRNSSGDVVIKNYEGIAYDAEKYLLLVSAVGNPNSIVTVARSASNELMEEYGLIEPQAYAVITDKNSISHRIDIGNALLSGGGYYACLHDENTVYVLNASYISKTVLCPIEDYVTPVLTAGIDLNDYYTINNFTVVTDGELFIRVNSRDKKDFKNEQSIAEFEIVYPVRRDVDATFYTNIIYNSNINGDRVELLGAEDTDYEKYSLTDPMYVISFKYKGTDYSVMVSDMLDDGGYYATSSMNPACIIYVSGDKLSFLQSDFIDWLDPYPMMHNITNISDIRVRTKDIDASFRLQHSKNEAGKDVLNVITSEGELFDENKTANFRQYYTSILDIMTSDYVYLDNDDKEGLISNESSLLLELSYTKTNKEEVSMKFYQYSTRRALMTINGEGELYVTVDRVKKIENDTIRCLKGEAVDPYSKD